MCVTCILSFVSAKLLRWYYLDCNNVHASLLLFLLVVYLRLNYGFGFIDASFCDCLLGGVSLFVQVVLCLYD